MMSAHILYEHLQLIMYSDLAHMILSIFQSNIIIIILKVKITGCLEPHNQMQHAITLYKLSQVFPPSVILSI